MNERSNRGALLNQHKGKSMKKTILVVAMLLTAAGMQAYIAPQIVTGGTVNYIMDKPLDIRSTGGPATMAVAAPSRIKQEALIPLSISSTGGATIPIAPKQGYILTDDRPWSMQPQSQTTTSSSAYTK